MFKGIYLCAGRRLVPLALACIWLPFCATAASAGEPSAKNSAKANDSDPVFAKSITDMQVAEDGTSQITVHTEMTPTNDAVARQISQIPIPYRDSMDTLEIPEAYTLKPDGKKIPVEPSAIFVQAPAANTNEPFFNDMRQKVVVFPQVAGGDKIVFTAVTKAKVAYFPGAFALTLPFNDFMDETEINISVPAAWDLNVETVGAAAEKHSSQNTVTYTWRYHPPAEKTKLSPSAVVHPEQRPHALISTFKTYDDFAHAYAAIVAGKAVATPKIRALAEEITANVSDRKMQAQKLYEWMGRNMRYVSISLGVGSIVPHDADTIAGLGYGDCKDYATLYKALLAAKGIASDIVLLNATNNYQLDTVPTGFEFNHAIVWLPEFKMYADTTSGVIPFGSLFFSEYGKPVVHAVSSGPAVHSIPILQPGAATLRLEATAHIDTEGRMIGNMSVEGTGPYSGQLRAMGSSIAAVGAKAAAKNYFDTRDMEGTGSIDAGAFNVLSPAYAIKGTFEQKLEPRSMSEDGFYISPGYRFTEKTGSFLLGQRAWDDLPRDEMVPCYSGTQVEDLHVYPPPGTFIADLPEDTDIQEKGFHFRAHWSRNGKGVSVHREFEANVDTALCSGAVRQAVLAAMTKIDANYAAKIRILKEENPLQAADVAAFGLAAAGEPANAAAYLNWADALSLTNQPGKAMQQYARAIALKPDYQKAYLNRGITLFAQSKFNEAIPEFTKAITLNPKDIPAYSRRSMAYRQLKRPDDSLADANAILALDPNAKFALWIKANLLIDQRKFTEVLETLAALNTSTADDAGLYIARGMAKDALQKYAEAVSDYDRALEIVPGDKNLQQLKQEAADHSK